jgi:ribonuclease HI
MNTDKSNSFPSSSVAMSASSVAKNPPSDPRPKVQLFTDGACIGNPGPGGWAFILQHPATGKSRESSGGEHATTNNRMEILAVIRGLESLKMPSAVELFSDSEYVVNAITSWMIKWKNFGWAKSKNKKEALKNADLWMRLDELRQLHAVKANWVKGHAGHRENERCDVLSVAAAAAVAKTPAPAVVPKPPQPRGQSLFEM